MVYLPNNRSCRGLKIVQNALECTMKWFYIVSQTFFMNSTMENPPWITVHLRLLLRNKLCTWHENKLPETFSVGQLSREIWNRCIQWQCWRFIWPCLVSDCVMPGDLSEQTQPTIARHAANEFGGWLKIVKRCACGWSQLRGWQHNKQLYFTLMSLAVVKGITRFFKVKRMIHLTCLPKCLLIYWTNI